eukprot:CAMPEP_0174699040 /NCGR_PEP_ID=MMETSP1094-20130205/4445_1 /TAXON_ID=156173 /ORGANISM="Chrysochromulina brevifilum, Strain UTEX LB 985" /LENGTH=203 /DNA_ID=CAMNT_0015896301 /DNA_START=305 /DNA_END=914 /DNA_ORIENTATION=+
MREPRAMAAGPSGRRTPAPPCFRPPLATVPAAWLLCLAYSGSSAGRRSAPAAAEQRRRRVRPSRLRASAVARVRASHLACGWLWQARLADMWLLARSSAADDQPVATGLLGALDADCNSVGDARNLQLHAVTRTLDGQIDQAAGRLRLWRRRRRREGCLGGGRRREMSGWAFHSRASIFRGGFGALAALGAFAAAVGGAGVAG